LIILGFSQDGEVGDVTDGGERLTPEAISADLFQVIKFA
jgi:hypothetical protein